MNSRMRRIWRLRRMDEESIEIPSLVPIFPLPEVVLFPRAVLPLHIFEPRYRKLTADVLEAGGLLGVALLKPGFEPHYYTLRAPIHHVLGLGQIVASEKLDDGNYNILLRGVGRVRINAEIPHKPYRLARVEPCAEAPSVPAGHLAKQRDALRQTVQSECVGDHELQEHWLRLFDTSLPLGDLADLIASVLPIDAELRQDLLVEADPAARAAAVREHIRTLASMVRVRRCPSPQAEWGMN